MYYIVSISRSGPLSYLDHNYKKSKSASKIQLPQGPVLKKKITDTVALVSSIVGSTLGPGGKTVLIERNEPGLPSFLTKDGVTCIRSLCFNDPVQEAILEIFRSSALTTVENSGDGTTTATLLAGSILNELNKYLIKYPKVNAQYAARELVKYTNDVIVPYILKSSLKVNVDNCQDLLLKVATISANGDADLAAKVMEAYNLVGDGHINIVEEPGYGTIEVTRDTGYPFDRGFEASLGMFSNIFINDIENNRVVLDNPHFILIDGKVMELNNLIPFMQLLENEYHKGLISPNIVLVAHSFSKEVVSKLGQFWKLDNALKILPVITPMDMLPNSQYDFLLDMSAWTGGQIFDSLTKPIHSAVPSDLGIPAKMFESQRYRSVLHGSGQESTLIGRVRELKVLANRPEATKLAASVFSERASRLSGGIATFKISCASEAESREKRDRADDAICSIRGAVKHGILPGGGRCLLVRSAVSIATLLSTLGGLIVFPRDGMLESQQSASHYDTQEQLNNASDEEEA